MPKNTKIAERVAVANKPSQMRIESRIACAIWNAPTASSVSRETARAIGHALAPQEWRGWREV